MKKHLLILNNGSSSIKFTIFNIENNKKELSGFFSTLTNSKSTLHIGKKIINYSTGYDLKYWWNILEDILLEYNIKYIGFRMVHGGEEFKNTAIVNKLFLKKIVKYNSLAPLHNPNTIQLIKLVKNTWPRVKMSVSFDTAWYSNLDPKVYLYSLPIKYYNIYKIRKYGFHGLSHESATKYASEALHKPLSKLNIVTCHLGSGSSLTLFSKGKAKDTTMGFAPNEGLTMSTRSGDISSGIMLYLLEKIKLTPPKLRDLVNKQSGLLGLCNMSDLREVLAASGYRVSGFKKAKFNKKQRQLAKTALDVYIYDIQRYLASYIAMSKKLDSIVFTGVVGVKSSIVRRLILRDLNIPKNCKIIIAPDGEMDNLANKTLKCLKKK